MGLCKHGVEQILADAGMENQETERKALARQISTKIRRGAMCSLRRNPEKGDILSTGSFYVEQERVTENRDKVPMGPSRGYAVLRKGQRSYVTTALRPVIKTGQAQPADGRRRKTTISQPTVAEITTRCNTKLAEETDIGDTTGL